MRDRLLSSRGLPAAYVFAPFPDALGLASLADAPEYALAVRYVPAWFPGAGFQRQAAVWHEAATRQLHVPYADYLRREVCI